MRGCMARSFCADSVHAPAQSINPTANPEKNFTVMSSWLEILSPAGAKAMADGPPLAAGQSKHPLKDQLYAGAVRGERRNGGLPGDFSASTQIRRLRWLPRDRRETSG